MQYLKEIEGGLTIPPDMQLQTSVCVTKEQLQPVLNGAFICTYTSSQPIPKAKHTRLWLYSCAWRS